MNLIDCGVFWLSQTPDIVGSIGWDAKRPRTVTWKLLENDNNHKLYVLNTHYDHVGREANINSAQVIAVKLKAFNTRYPIVLCGDFNSSEDMPAYQKIIDIGFTNTRSETATIREPSMTYHMYKMDIFNDKSAVTELMKGHNRIFKCIDHIFTSGAFTIFNNSIIDDVVLGLYPSDHFPVVCDLDFHSPSS